MLLCSLKRKNISSPLLYQKRSGDDFGQWILSRQRAVKDRNNILKDRI